jgi:hypothetical protein
MGWWPVSHPRWGVTEPMQILHPSTIKSLWRLDLLDGIPDRAIAGKTPGVQPEVWTSDKGKKLLEDISRDTGIIFDTTTDELIVPGFEQAGSPSVMVH